jgi:hypothetical protein
MAVLLLVLASCAVMGGANRVETVGVAVGAHVLQLGHLFNGTVTAVLVGVHVLVVWLVKLSELSDGGNELLDLGCHCSEFGAFALVGLAHVGNGIVTGDGCTCNFGNVVFDLVTDVGHVVGTVIVVAPCHGTAAVLDVRVMGLDSCLEVVLGPCVVGLGGVGLLFPFHHLSLVKNVEIVNFLQVELELVLVQVVDVRLHDGGLVVVKMLSKGSEVLLAVPF